MTKDNLISNSFRTNFSDPIFFRVKSNRSIAINDKTFYLTKDYYNVNSGFVDIDIFLDWSMQTIMLLYDKMYIDYMLSASDQITNFYHNELTVNETMPNKVLIYNLFPNTSCIVKNLQLCEEYCDQGIGFVKLDSKMLYQSAITDTLSSRFIKTLGFYLIVVNLLII
jgi:hypothetical protein